jgi:hypothetical protein
MRGVAPFGELAGAVRDREGVGWAWGLVLRTSQKREKTMNHIDTEHINNNIRRCRECTLHERTNQMPRFKLATGGRQEKEEK